MNNINSALLGKLIENSSKVASPFKKSLQLATGSILNGAELFYIRTHVATGNVEKWHIEPIEQAYAKYFIKEHAAT